MALSTEPVRFSGEAKKAGKKVVGGAAAKSSPGNQVASPPARPSSSDWLGR